MNVWLDNKDIVTVHNATSINVTEQNVAYLYDDAGKLLAVFDMLGVRFILLKDSEVEFVSDEDC